MHHELGDLDFCHATKQLHLPTVLTPLEISSILNQLDGRDRLIIELLYASGLRVSECLRLCVEDIDIERTTLTVIDGKGRKDRQTILSHKCAEKLIVYIDKAIKIQQHNNQLGIGPSLPRAVERTYQSQFKAKMPSVANLLE
ncbi:hypothetical protein TUM3792_14590 [Shewanella sp. MBTL60-007]|nr:hypothetical protein TUM3792_14590 [Shewanella sp. MBTL60-007]